MRFKTASLGLIICLILFEGACFAFSNPFAKKYDKEEEKKEPMVHTVEEWMETASDVKMDMRKREEDENLKDENLIPPTAEIPLYIERYNVKAGSKELDLTQIYKKNIIRSTFVSDPSFENAVYSEVYYYPQTRQTASTVFLIELDGFLGKKERLSDVSIFEHTRYPLISTALPYLKEGLFSTLTVVDFSKDGKTLLVKEKRGSNKYGLYETYVWLYYLTDESRDTNVCYQNNINFSNEIAAYDGLDGREGAQRGGSTDPRGKFDGNLSNNSGNYSLNELKDAPDIQLIPIKGDTGSSITLELAKLPNSAGEKRGQGINSDFNNPDYNWLKEGVVNVGKKYPGAEYGFKEEDMPNLDYKEIKNFIKATWKADTMTSPFNSRWYNKMPVDFRVDDSYESGKENVGFGVRLNLLNEMIKAYWFDRKSLILNHIRWDIKPLGFNSSNDDEIVVTAFAYGNDGREISLGNWAVNIKNGIPRLMGEDEPVQIGAWGFYLEQKLNTR